MQSKLAMQPQVQVSPEQTALRATCSHGLSGASLALALLEQSEDCVKLISLSGHLEYINCGGLHAMQIDCASDVLGKVWWELWPGESRSYVHREFSYATGGTPRQFVAACPTAKGKAKLWRVDLKPLVAPAGPVVSVLCCSRDITGMQQIAA